MEKLFGKLSLAAQCELSDDQDGLAAVINEVIAPPQPVSRDDVYLGVLYAASDQVNLQGGCFAPPELQTLAELVVGAPVLVTPTFMMSLPEGESVSPSYGALKTISPLR